MNQKADLEKILNGLGSDEARAYAISKLVGKVDLPVSQVEKAVDIYEQAGDFYTAAKVAYEAGMMERAVEVYENAGKFDAAARVARKAGMTERAKQLKILVKLINQ